MRLWNRLLKGLAHGSLDEVVAPSALVAVTAAILTCFPPLRMVSEGSESREYEVFIDIVERRQKR